MPVFDSFYWLNFYNGIPTIAVSFTASQIIHSNISWQGGGGNMYKLSYNIQYKKHTLFRKFILS